MENVKKEAKKFNTFAKYDPILHIHGNHIHKGEVGGWKHKMTEKAIEYVNEKFKRELKILGYE